MKIVFGILLLLLSSCHSLKHPILLHEANDYIDLSVKFTHYNKNDNVYHGKATINNLSKDRVLKISGFVVKNEKQSYTLYFDSIANIVFIEVNPGESTIMDVITKQIPKDENVNLLKLDLNFPTRSQHPVRNFILK